MSYEKKDRGIVEVDENECKGCSLCVEACPTHVLSMGQQLNHYGYPTAFYEGTGCTGCGICSISCPEPGAITVYHLDPAQAAAASIRQAAFGGVA